MYIYDIKMTRDQEKTKVGILFDIGFVGALGIHICSFMCSTTSISKLCNPKVRGTMFGFNALIGSIFTLIL